MKELPITRRDGSVWVVLLDDADYERVVTAGPWCIDPPSKTKRTAYAKKTIQKGSRRGSLYLHRFLRDGEEVDHINGNGLDNRQENLRPCGRYQNQQNVSLTTKNTSGLKGASWNKRLAKWDARISARGVQYFLGYFATKEEAHAAYCRAALEVHESFANLGQTTGHLNDSAPPVANCSTGYFEMRT